MTDSAELLMPMRTGEIRIHDAEGFEGMRKAGRLVAECLDMIAPHVQPGVTTAHLDDLIRTLVLDHVEGQGLGHLRRRDSEVRDYWIRELIDRVELAPDQLTVILQSKQIEACLDVQWSAQNNASTPPILTCPYKPVLETRKGFRVLTLALQIKRLDGKRLLLSPEGQDLVIPESPEPQQHLVTAIGHAYYWRERMMQESLTVKSLAMQLRIRENRIRKYLPLINLSPMLVKRILTGDHPSRVTLVNLLEAAKHLDWDQQAHFLGMQPLIAGA